jgi:hypothetical protein
MFQEIKVDARRLPNRYGEEASEPPAEQEPPAIVTPEPPAIVENKAEPAPEPPKPLPQLVVVERPAAKKKPTPRPAVQEAEAQPIEIAPPRREVEVEYWWPAAVGR